MASHTITVAHVDWGCLCVLARARLGARGGGRGRKNDVTNFAAPPGPLIERAAAASPQARNLPGNPPPGAGDDSRPHPKAPNIVECSI